MSKVRQPFVDQEARIPFPFLLAWREETRSLHEDSSNFLNHHPPHRFEIWIHIEKVN